MLGKALKMAAATALAGALVIPVATSAAGRPVAAPAPARPASAARPNILFILIDDMGFSDLSIMGNRKVQTPNMDRLARQGLLMTQFYDAAPICSASRAAFMTGEFPARNRFWNFIDTRAHDAATGQADWLDPRIPSLPRALKQIGYATGHFGKWHLGGGRDVGDAPLPAAYGFDESYVNFEGLGPRAVPTDDSLRLSKMSIALGKGPVDQMPKSKLTARFIDKALDFIGRHKHQPWFVEIWPDDVHRNWVPSAAQLAATKSKGDNADDTRFLAVLAAMDKQIGRLVDTLKASGQLTNTIIVLTSDNGPAANAIFYKRDGTPPGSAAPLRGRKNSLYEGGTRQPLIVDWPGHVPAGIRDDSTVADAVDLFPTIAAITGCARPGVQDGISLLAAWHGHPIARRPDLYWTYGAYGPYKAWTHPGLPHDRSPTFAVRSGKWKLLADGDGSHAELYDIVADPIEAHDLARRQPALVKRLTARLVGWVRSLPERPSFAKPPVEGHAS